MTALAKLAKRAADAKAALDAAIVAERAKGRTLRAIGDECDMTSAGVLYVVRKAQATDEAAPGR